MLIDLRSDTVTKPSPAMLEFILSAAVGDDVYHEDPTVNALQEKLKQLFGVDEALYFPTGTMANQAAIKLHTQPGQQLICDHYAHVYNYEGGGVSFNSGVSCKLIVGDSGKITAEQVEASINPPDFYHSPLTRLVCVENTTNKGGGACYSLEELNAIKKVCEKHNLGFHMDGARLFNALVATGQSAKDYGKMFDTISVCLSKGLGAPMGSVLLGKKALMREAVRIRKVLGGGMRQVGYMAAAGIYALENNIDRLQEDHQKAKEIADCLASVDYVEKIEPVATNIIIFYLKPSVKAEDFQQKLHQNSIKISDMGQGKWRIVTHLDYTDAMHNRCLDFFKTLSI